MSLFQHFWSGAAVVTLVGLLPLVAGFGPEDPAAEPTPADPGKEIYLKNCAACHGRDALGIPGLGKDLVDSEFARRLSDEALVQFIERGRPTGDSLNTTGVAMPPKGGNPALTRYDLEVVVAYLRSLE